MDDLKLKRRRLESIKSEVNDFHPLLGNLFPQLEQIRHVEYTHGPQEKGADFILEKFDLTLSEINYVGVIVKIGKIQQDITAVERQIDECSIPRIVRNGKRKIHLNEIWVVSNNSISANAKEKIHHKFSTAKIHFLDGDRIIDLIDQHAAYFWHDVPTLVGHYLLSLWQKNDEIDRQSNLLTTADTRLYIDIDLARIEETSSKKTKKNRPNQS